MTDESMFGSGGMPPKPAEPERPAEPAAGKKKGAVAGAFQGLRVSLVPKDMLGEDAPDLRSRLISAAMVLGTVAILVLVAVLVLNRQLTVRAAEMAELERQYQAVAAEAADRERQMGEASLFGRQMKAAAAALDRHIYLTELMDFLEASVLPGVVLERVSADAQSGLVSLDVTAPSYRAMAEQIVLFGEIEEISQMRNTSVSGAVGRDGRVSHVSSSVILNVTPKLWTGHPAMAADSRN